MSSPGPRPIVALLQIRSRPDAAEQEERCYLERMRLEPEQLLVHNLVTHPEVRLDHVDRADALVVGGAGGHSVLHHHPFTHPLEDLVGSWIDSDRPLFGSCWGHQFLGLILGGEVIHDPEGGEVGTYPIRLTEAGRQDPLFAGMPSTFDVQLGHHDRIAVLPPGAVELADSELCPFQTLRIEGKPIYGTQFHAELAYEDMLERLEMYRDSYAPGEEREAVLERLHPSPGAEGVLLRFLELVT